MSEFRKSYEYEEDRGSGGLLMLYFLMLVSVELLLAAMLLVQGYALLKGVPYLGPGFLVIGLGYLSLILVTCLLLRRRSRYAVTISRIFLIARLLYVSPVLVLLYTSSDGRPGILPGFRSESDRLVFGLVVPLAYTVLFSGLWLYYFTSSRRVEQLARGE